MTKKRIIVSIAIIVVLAAGVGAYLYVRHQDRNEPKTTSKSPTAQADYDKGAPRQNNQSSGADQGGVVDTGGADIPVTPPASSVSSESGIITVSTPIKDAALANGAVVAGMAKGLSKVQYRLIDDTVGVIAQGALDVTNGAFSGKLQFTSKAHTGRLDIFSFDTASTEQNEVQIPVRF